MTTKSQYGFETTDQRLEGAIQTHGLHLFSVIDHGEAAAAAGMTLGRSRLYIFGNPKAGTAFMAANPEFGLELPLKALVYESDGAVYVAVSDIKAAAAGHNISAQQAPITIVSEMLDALVSQATGQAPAVTASAA